ncbi:hypothetical protein [Planctomycetes bacterium K23_9]|uniref:Uncharacterized protein n=1 Tax=Stieleria marina TaxID=1930275 RepID=A0A517NNG3_9BACT|nr:hypothetical protein K239x_06080 [Planctomycetes bacterium K23_9]
MASYLLRPRLSDLRWQMWLAVLVLASRPASSTAEEPRIVVATNWQAEQMEALAKKTQTASTDDDRLEYLARQSWLRRWKPGKMPSAPSDAPFESELVDEPLLKHLERPAEVASSVWQQMIALQTQLLVVDTDDERKENLRRTIPLAKQLETVLSDELPTASQPLETPTGWALAYTRYRLGRAVAYRELPVVREAWPISNPERYEKELVAIYTRLTEQTEQDRPEFILLQDRMFRRSGKKGRALELLEANRRSIEPKWYLKKRRDLLKELGWDPPYHEAARLYRQAGYDDDQ